MRLFLRINFAVNHLPQVQKLDHKKSTFPQDFYHETNEYVYFGYFAVYNKKIKPQDILTCFRSNNFDQLNTVSGDFICFYFNKKNGQLSVVNDLIGQITCYFAHNKENWLFSLDLADIQKYVTTTLNWNKVAELLVENPTVDDQTAFNEVRVLPPGSALILNKRQECKIDSYLGEEFLNDPHDAETDINLFRNEYLALLNKIVKEHINTIQRVNFGARLSSGLDSSLVNYVLKQNETKFNSYSIISPHTKKFDLKSDIHKFSSKHRLHTTYFDASDYFIFADNHSIFKKQPAIPIFARWHNTQIHFNQMLKKHKTKVMFTGNYHENLYFAPLFFYARKYRPQIRYFSNVEIKQRLDKNRIFSHDFTRLLTDKKWFSRRTIVPLLNYDDAHAVVRDSFQTDNPFNIFNIHPFLDFRLVTYFARLPRIVEKMRIGRKDLLKPFSHIYLHKQFENKTDFAYLYTRYATKRKKFCLELLSNSVLDKLGLIHADVVSSIIKNGYNGNFANHAYIANILMLEFYLQNTRREMI